MRRKNSWSTSVIPIAVTIGAWLRGMGYNNDEANDKGGVLAASLFWMSAVFVAGVWDDNVVLLGVNGNGSYQAADDVRIKKGSGGNST